MGIDLSESILLIAGGVVLSSSFAIIHFASTFNRFNRSLALLGPVFLSVASIYAMMMLSEEGATSTLRSSIATSLVGLVTLFPVFAAILTVVLFRITLLTNRSVGASSQ